MQYKTYKTADQSIARQDQIVLSQHLNGSGRLFGGVLMQWIDVIAAVAARRHSGRGVTTARVDNLVFEAPAFIDDLISMTAKLVYVGRTSMEVKVDTYVEHSNGESHKINTAYLVLVALDSNGRSVEVPRLAINTDEEKLEWELAEKRRQNR